MKQNQDIRNKNLYEELLAYVQELHEKNKKRIKVGVIVLLLLPVILGLIRWLTDSDKILFLFIWVLCMFILSAYLVGVEYLDHTTREKLKKMTGTEEDLGGLIGGHDVIPDKVKNAVKGKLEGGDE